MKFENYIKLSSKEKLEIFLKTLLKTNRTKDYYVNWNKVIKNVENYEIELNLMNYLIGKENIYNECLNIFKKYPETIKVLPILVAIRDTTLDLLILEQDKKIIENYDFINIDKDIEKYVKLADKLGILSFLKNKLTKSLVDYVYGVEVGLDSNGRKNRSGSIMEEIVSKYIDNICLNSRYIHKSQITVKYIYDTWNIKVDSDESERKFDNVIYDKEKNKIFIIETNYYGSSGTKLKAVCGEFIGLNNLLKNNNKVTFIWITDGIGWIKSHIPMLDAINKIENIFNLDMIEKGYLKEILK